MSNCVDFVYFIQLKHRSDALFCEILGLHVE